MKKIPNPNYTSIEIQRIFNPFNWYINDNRKRVVEHIKEYTEFKTLRKFLRKHPEYLDDFI